MTTGGRPDRRTWLLWLLTALVSVALGLLVAGTALYAYVKACQAAGRDVDSRLSHRTIVRRLFTRPDYLELLRVLARSRGERFATLWDFDASTLLSKDQFVPTEMYGQLRYRYRPDLPILDVSVWSGLSRTSFSVVETPDLVRALEPCRVLRRVSFGTDGLGFKRTEFGLPPGVSSVLFLGDSFTEGLHVRSEDTFVNLFGRRLRDAGLAGVPVNAGVNGYGALEEAWTAARFGSEVGARVVVENLFLNDVHGDPARVMDREVPPGSYREMFRFLALLAEDCARHRRDLVVAVIPAKEQLRRGPEARHFQEQVGRWCRERGLRFLDPLSYLGSAGGEANYFSWTPT